MRWIRARFVLLAAFVALLLVAAWGEAPYFCRMMGRAVPHCCCGSEQEFSAADEKPTIDASGCCERITISSSAGVATANDSSAKPPAIVAAIAVLPATDVALRFAQLNESLLASARAPPALGPPTYVIHCALLI